MRLNIPTGKTVAVPTGKRLNVWHRYLPSIRDRLRFTPPLRHNSRAIYAGGRVASTLPSTEDVDVDGTYFDSAGILQDAVLNELRIEKNGGLLEVTRENLVPDSENLASSTPWSHANLTYTANVVVAPDGTTTVDRIAPSADNPYIYQDISIASGTESYAMTVYFPKVASAPTNLPGLIYRFVIGGTQTWYTVSVNTKTGVVTETDGAGLPGSLGALSLFEAVLVTTPFGDFWRVTMVGANVNDTTVNVRVLGAIATAAAPGAYVTNLQGTVHPWGIQLEKAPRPSSYIPTTGSSKTRTNDLLTYASSGNFIGGSPFTFALAVTPAFDDSEGGIFTLLSTVNAAWNSGILCRRRSDGQIEVRFRKATGSSAYLIANPDLPSGQTLVVIVTAKTDNYNMYFDGVPVAADVSTPGPLPPTHYQIDIGNAKGDTNYWSGNIAHPMVYDRALSADECASLTTEIQGWMP